MNNPDREAFEAEKKAFADNHAWFQTMLSNKMDGRIAEHFWQAALARCTPKLTVKDAVEIIDVAASCAFINGKRGRELEKARIDDLRAAGVRFRESGDAKHEQD